MKKTTFEQAVTRSRSVHGDKYEYKEMFHDGRYLKLRIVCPEHGEFVQTASNHYIGRGCQKCTGKHPQYTLEDVEAIAREKYQFNYTYRKLVRGGKYPMLHLTCQKHGEFEQHLYNHLAGKGCEKCGEERVQLDAEALVQLKYQQGIKLVREVERNNYNQRQLLLKCDIHGEFIMPLQSVSKGFNCPKCANITRGENSRLTLSDVKQIAELVHGNKYKYRDVVFNGKHTRVIATCDKHGDFEQKTDNHLRGQGCPVCKFGKAEQEFKQFISSLTETQTEARLDPDSQMRWDVYAPNENLAFEFNGTYWHSDKFKSSTYHRDKYRKAADKGIRTMTIYEDEWQYQKPAVESAIRAALGKTIGKLHARKLYIVVPSAADANYFFDKYHIQKQPTGSRFIALCQEGEIKAVLAYALKKPGRGRSYDDSYCEITRYASSVQVVGGFSRLLKHVLNTYPSIEKVYTFSDVRFFSGKMYAKLGFVVEQELRPDYFYIKGGRRFHKANAKKDRLGGPEELGELERAELNGLHRVYDCGKLRWRLDVQRNT